MEPGTGPPSLVAVLNHPEDLRVGLPWVATIARQARMPVRLLHVVDPVYSREHPDNAILLAQDMLALAASSPLLGGLEVGMEVLSGATEHVLPAHAGAHPGALHVLVGGEHGAFSRSLLGRGSDNVIRRLEAPFLFLPPAVGESRPLRRILVGFDRSDASRAIVGLARSIAVGTSSEVTVLEAFEPGDVKAEVFAAISPTFERERIVMRGRPGPSLLAAARIRDVDLIAVGSHGWGRALGEHLGSTARWLSRHADRPLLIVPQPRAS